MLTDDQVRHVAKLARLHLSDEEVARFSPQLSAILEYMDILSELDTSEVELTSQVTGLSSVTQKDEVVRSNASREELLAQTELSVELNQIKVKRAI